MVIRLSLCSRSDFIMLTGRKNSAPKPTNSISKQAVQLINIKVCRTNWLTPNIGYKNVTVALFYPYFFLFETVSIFAASQKTSNKPFKNRKTMKEIEKISHGTNYTAVSVGKTDELRGHILKLGLDVAIAGKVFAGTALGTTGCEISFQHLNPGEGSAFLHTHKTHEELYIITKGNGEYQVDGTVFPVAEGTIVRVAPEGRRALRNNGSEPMVVICIQYRAGSFGKDDDIFTDANILSDTLNW